MARNKQPHYHRITFLFTTTDGGTLTDEMLVQRFQQLLANADIAVVPKTIEVEENTVEAGDPVDLV